MSDENLLFSLRTIKAFGEIIPEFDDFYRRYNPESYDEFIENLYIDIDKIIKLIEEDPKVRKDDGEDRLTVEIRGMLLSRGYMASHDEMIGGHADLVVRKKDYIWIGEAKKHSNYEWLLKGFNQLTTRYTTGDTNQNNGGLLIYIFGKNASRVMSKWQEFLTMQSLPDYSWGLCNKRELAFFSKHTHDKSGLSFRVRHMPILLYFSPQDRKDNV
jgi:hypothetical protein